MDKNIKESRDDREEDYVRLVKMGREYGFDDEVDTLEKLYPYINSTVIDIWEWQEYHQTADALREKILDKLKSDPSNQRIMRRKEE